MYAHTQANARMHTHWNVLGFAKFCGNISPFSFQICKITVSVFFLLCGKSFVPPPQTRKDLVLQLAETSLICFGKKHRRIEHQMHAAVWSLPEACDAILIAVSYESQRSHFKWLQLSHHQTVVTSGLCDMWQ